MPPSFTDSDRRMVKCAAKAAARDAAKLAKSGALSAERLPLVKRVTDEVSLCSRLVS